MWSSLLSCHISDCCFVFDCLYTNIDVSIRLLQDAVSCLHACNCGMTTTDAPPSNSIIAHEKHTTATVHITCNNYYAVERICVYKITSQLKFYMGKGLINTGHDVFLSGKTHTQLCFIECYCGYEVSDIKGQKLNKHQSHRQYMYLRKEALICCTAVYNWSMDGFLLIC